MGFRQLYRPPATVRAYVFILLGNRFVGVVRDRFDQGDFDQGLPLRFLLINIVVIMITPVLLAEGVLRRRSRFVWVVAVIYSGIAIVGFFASWSFNLGSILDALGPPSFWIYTLLAVVELTLLLMPGTRAWVRRQGAKLV